jgi:hypothetical protein
MPCIQREVLLGHFAAAAAAYSTAVVRMKDLNGLEFQQAWDDAETLLEDREVARQDLADHDRDHGCLRKPAASVPGELIAAKAGA